MKTHIIVEGMDDTGKSTLCDILHRRFEAPVVREHRFWMPWLDHGKFWLNDVPWPDGKHVIYDRFPMVSEPVYGPILRPEVTTAHRQSADYGRALGFFEGASDDIVVIHCFARAGSSRLQLEGVIDHSHEIAEAYQEVMQDLRELGVTVLDYDHRWSSDRFNLFLTELMVALEMNGAEGEDGS